jgi:hypothetical protein
MPVKRFKFTLKYSALEYLNYWYGYESRFADDLLPSKPREVRLRCIQDAAKYYGVSRNFKIIPGEERLENALQALDGIGNPVTNEKVDSMVRDLAKRFQLIYGKEAISAASKFLWIRHKSPVVIYDDRAFRCLMSCGSKLGQGEYAKYRSEWLKQFNYSDDEIRLACAELVRVKDFSLAHDKRDEDVASVVANRWFRERVFDIFLWSNSDD